MRIAIADDHQLVREGIAQLLEDEPDVVIVGEASDGTELMELITRTPVDIILLDIRMPGLGGLEVLEQLAGTAGGPQVVVLSMHDDPIYVQRAIELGAAGYLLKHSSREELLTGLRTVADGGTYIHADLASHVLQGLAGRGQAPTLSPREREVLALVAAGHENKQIARELGLAEATVKGYMTTMFQRLGVRSRAEAVAVGFRHGLID